MFIVCHTDEKGLWLAICVRLYDQFWNVRWSQDCLLNHSTAIKMEHFKKWKQKNEKEINEIVKLIVFSKGRTTWNAECTFFSFFLDSTLTSLASVFWVISCRIFDRLLWLINLIIPKGNWFSVVESHTTKTTKDIAHTWQKKNMTSYQQRENNTVINRWSKTIFSKVFTKYRIHLCDYGLSHLEICVKGLQENRKHWCHQSPL